MIWGMDFFVLVHILIGMCSVFPNLRHNEGFSQHNPYVSVVIIDKLFAVFMDRFIQKKGNDTIFRKKNTKTYPTMVINMPYAYDFWGRF